MKILLLIPLLCSCGLIPSSEDVAALRSDLAITRAELEQKADASEAAGKDELAALQRSQADSLGEFDRKAEALGRAVEGLEEAGEGALSLADGGLLTGAGGALLWFLRNQTRKKERELLLTPAPGQRPAA